MVLFSCLLFELCCGMHFPAIASIRSLVVPENVRAGGMTLFRFPLNGIVGVLLMVRSLVGSIRV